MKRVVASVAIIIGLAACGGVDREGTRDLFVKTLKDSGVEVDTGCVDDALDQFSDDELKKIDSQAKKGESSEQLTALTADLIACAKK